MVFVYLIYMTVKFLFYFGWLRVAETLYNPFGGDPWSSPNEVGKITLFPGWVSHGTDKVIDSQERITIAFDIFTEDGYINTIKDDMKSHWIKL